jgi:hypothetical protein
LIAGGIAQPSGQIDHVTVAIQRVICSI